MNIDRICVLVIYAFIVVNSGLTYSQTIQKYIIDGKTYYGAPPDNIDNASSVREYNIRLSNTYVSQGDRVRANDRLSNDKAAWARDIDNINDRESQSIRSQASVQRDIIKNIEVKEKQRKAHDKLRGRRLMDSNNKRK